jgi:23S rRNA (adenine2030-N6)-methyltransferase
LVLIDPSYEVKREYDEVVVAIEKAWKKMPQTVFLLWYPVTDRQRNRRLEKRFQQSAMRNVQLFELGIDDDGNGGMSASGMIIVNPPWTLAKSFAQTMPDVSARFSVDGVSRIRNEVLVPE